jgi:arginyl-tRNA synthetase
LLKNELTRRLEEHLRSWAAGLGAEVPVFAQGTPRPSLGDAAFSFPLKLAGRLKRPPLEIAKEAAAKAFELPFVERAEAAPPGFVNVYFKRKAYLVDITLPRSIEGARRQAPGGRQQETAAGHDIAPAVSPLTSHVSRAKVIVEHTNINPNKAAHIGHLRNAVLGDTLVRLLRHAGHAVEVQNYIDNTGVQVADVVVGLLHLDGRPWETIAAEHARLDYFAWDLYARVSAYYDEDAARLEIRQKTLKHIEEGTDPEAGLARNVAQAMTRCHLATMYRLGITYDVLPKESEVLSYHLWEKAFALLKKRHAVALETEGKNKGCWVLSLKESPAFKKMQDPDKVLVRSNDTITYTGKDIAYQMWKFGLLGTDFAYRPFHTYPESAVVWETCPPPGQPGAPPFGKAQKVFNVIDVRQSYLQEVVKEALAVCEFEKEAQSSVHFAYEMVSLSEKLARQMGAGEKGAVAMSGRKGIGVKADDLLDALEARAREEVEKRHAELPEGDRAALARDIAAASVKFFMLKFGKEKIIAFDFDEALNFDGDSGPYLQYSLVRARAIMRKLAEAGRPIAPDPAVLDTLAEPLPEDLWEFLMKIEDLDSAVERALSGLDPSAFAHYTLDLAGAFHVFYHNHPLLREEDAKLYHLRLALLDLFCKRMEEAFRLLGLPVPEKM